MICDPGFGWALNAPKRSLSCPLSSLGGWEAKGTLCFPERCAGLWAEARSQPSVRRAGLRTKSVEGRGKDSEPESSLLRKIPSSRMRKREVSGGSGCSLKHPVERRGQTWKC